MHTSVSFTIHDEGRKVLKESKIPEKTPGKKGKRKKEGFIEDTQRSQGDRFGRYEAMSNKLSLVKPGLVRLR